jgi:hypothetical protein
MSSWLRLRRDPNIEYVQRDPMNAQVFAQTMVWGIAKVRSP